jgi:branched-chain amino acid transport system ATP-binding protein
VTGTEPLLELTGLSAGYGGVQALREADIRVDAGEFVVLLGPNGAGKTTTLRTVSGLLRPTAGTIRLAGRDITRMPGWRRTGLGIGHVPEGRQIFPDHTVEENLRLGAFAHRRRRARTDRALTEVLELFPRLGERRDQKAGTLSGGEAQMLAIARALMSRPRFLMLDEPSLGIMPRLVDQVMDSLRRLHETEGLTMFLVEQNVPAALDLADRGYVLQTGRVVLEGHSSELRGSDLVRKAYLGM